MAAEQQGDRNDPKICFRRLPDADLSSAAKNWAGLLRMTAQQAAPIAVAAAEMTAAERSFRAVIKLIVAAAMIGAIWTRGKVFVPAMIAKTRRQLLRILPIGAHNNVGNGAGRRHQPRACRRHKAPQ